ncbi:outer membrane beta-barrel family protein [Dyadobacter sp.]|uniref:outer membrane beta-barrel family protein n=1 Tax=Dyadobacter sp. TaxID=1914288 RepID=UPI0025BC834F|nr:outer membrane beta-barrel family protein [Dyadobacter sp.]
MKTLFQLLMSILIPGLVCCQDSFAQVAPTAGAPAAGVPAAGAPAAGAPAAGITASGSIKGVVADSATGKVLDFITVNLMKDKSTAVKADFSKADGSFAFQNLKPMKYALVLVGVGYKNKTIDVDLTDSTRRQVDLGNVTISQQAVGLKEVTVTALKPIVKQEVDRISYDLEADPESKVYSVLEMMRKVPYLSLDAEDNISLKGNTDFKILINGKPSSMVERSYKDVLRSMPASSIVRIEVITTPPAKYDAEGLAGIINIITNKKIDNGYNGTLNVSERFPTGGPGVGGSLSAQLGKIGMSLNAGLNQYKNPATQSITNRTTTGTNPTELDQRGWTEINNKNGYIGYEITYEVDTLNLLSAQLNVNGGRNSQNGYQSSLLNADKEILERYNASSKSSDRGNGRDAAINYQKGFKSDKSRLLTFSYRYYGYDNKQNGNIGISDRINYDRPDYRQVNDQSFSEQTFQVDLVYPVKKLNIEAGLKGIVRDNKSDFQYLVFDPETNSYSLDAAMSNKYNNTQKVFGAYNTYQYNFKNWGVKAGARVEQTIIDADFISTDSKVKQNYFNFIPSVSINRKLKNNAGINFGFTQRIQRPGIWQLNPFVDRSNPSFERTGNPDLRPAYVNDLQLSYNKSKKGSINFGVGYTHFKDLIFQIAVYNPETQITRTSYGNTGRARLISGNLNANYPITKKWNFSTNLRIAHGKVTGMVNGIETTNSGVMYQFSLSTGYKLPKDWRVNANLNANGPGVNLQGTTNSIQSTSFSVSKDVVKDKLSLSAAVSNPFTKFRRFHNSTFGPDFDQFSDRWNYFRSFNFSLNYKFGKLKDIKKNKRGIRNDDVQNGGN